MSTFFEKFRSNGKDKIYISEDNHDIYKELKDEIDLFSTMKGIFLAAAALGFKKNQRKPLDKKKDIFPKTLFTEEEVGFLYMLAIADKKEEDVIIEDDILSIAEEYANAGIEIIKKTIKHYKNKKEAIDALLLELVNSP